MYALKSRPTRSMGRAFSSPSRASREARASSAFVAYSVCRVTMRKRNQRRAIAKME
jgi:hypothetical protein